MVNSAHWFFILTYTITNSIINSTFDYGNILYHGYWIWCSWFTINEANKSERLHNYLVRWIQNLRYERREIHVAHMCYRILNREAPESLND